SDGAAQRGTGPSQLPAPGPHRRRLRATHRPLRQLGHLHLAAGLVPRPASVGKAGRRRRVPALPLARLRRARTIGRLRLPGGSPRRRAGPAAARPSLAGLAAGRGGPSPARAARAPAPGALSEEERALSRAEQGERAEALRALRRDSMRAELERHPITRFFGPGVTKRVHMSLAWAGVRTAADVGAVSFEPSGGRGRPA